MFHSFGFDYCEMLVRAHRPWEEKKMRKSTRTCLQNTPSPPGHVFQTLFVAGGTSRYIRSQHLKEIGKLFPKFVVSTIKGAG